MDGVFDVTCLEPSPFSLAACRSSAGRLSGLHDTLGRSCPDSAGRPCDPPADSAADQALKLQVRDAVLAHTNTLLARTSNAGEATRVLEENLSELTQTARQEIAARGSAYPVAVRLEETWFPTRTYENVSLPAGNYLALRVLIGEAAGKNWWCVVFPSLCLSAVSETSLQAAGLSHGEYALIQEDEDSYQIRFKAVEWWQMCKHWLHGQD